jgi:LytS/YehU family sensor histidine kinase
MARQDPGFPVASKRLRAMPALTIQAHTHALANTLSLAGALSRRRPGAAEDLLTYVAAALRSRAAPSRPFAPLADEVRTVLVLIGIERARLGGRLRVDLACEGPALEVLVPPLLLHPLVENAIHHGIARRPAGGCLRICAAVRRAMLILTVADDGPGVPGPAARRPGWGLVWLRLRLDALWGSRARVRVLSRSGKGTLAAVVLPASHRGGRP